MNDNWDILKDIGRGRSPIIFYPRWMVLKWCLYRRVVFTIGISEEEFVNFSLLDERINPIFATEIPDRAVFLKSFYIDRYPVTNYQYMKFVKETDHRPPLLWNEPLWNQPMQPVVFVDGMMPDNMQDGPVNLCRPNFSGKKLGAGPTVDHGPGVMSLNRIDATAGNTVLNELRKSVYLIKGPALTAVMICAEMYGKCAKGPGLRINP